MRKVTPGLGNDPVLGIPGGRCLFEHNFETAVILKPLDSPNKSFHALSLFSDSWRDPPSPRNTPSIRSGLNKIG